MSLRTVTRQFLSENKDEIVTISYTNFLAINDVESAPMRKAKSKPKNYSGPLRANVCRTEVRWSLETD